MFHARTATKIAAVLAAYILTLPGDAAGASPGRKPASNLRGTTVMLDGHTPVPRARITVMPESTVTYTDADGDFLVSWDGHDGWITVNPEERTREGAEWCKRVVLRGQAHDAQDPILDLGLITVMPRATVGYRLAPILPSAYPRRDSLHVPGPKPGEPDTCRVQVSYATDIWGRITRVEVSGGAEPPEGLKAAIFSWIRSVSWIVAAETPCEPPEPFKAREWMDYAWAGSAWVQIRGLAPEGRLKASDRAPQGR